ncbi:MAG: hypothetical protein Q9195_007786 [Heterodermia aff. obscurata]
MTATRLRKDAKTWRPTGWVSKGSTVAHLTTYFLTCFNHFLEKSRTSSFTEIHAVDIEGELEMSELAPHDTPSRNQIIEQLESVVSTSSNWSSEESDDEISTSGLDSVRDGMDASIALIAPMETTSIVSRRTSATAMESHGISFHQADVRYSDTIMLADNRPTTVLDQVQRVDSSSTNQPAIEFSTFSGAIFPGSDSGLPVGSDHMPQTPTHTPVQPTATGTRNEEVPPLDLDAASENLNRMDQGPRRGLYLVPGDDSYVLPGNTEGDPVRGAYRLGTLVSLARTTANASQRIHLALPNPRNLATVEIVMTVPYELGRDPVSLEVALPPRNSPFVRDRHYMVELEVTQDADYDDDDQDRGVGERKYKMEGQINEIPLAESSQLQSNEGNLSARGASEIGGVNNVTNAGFGSAYETAEPSASGVESGHINTSQAAVDLNNPKEVTEEQFQRHLRHAEAHPDPKALPGHLELELVDGVEGGYHGKGIKMLGKIPMPITTISPSNTENVAIRADYIPPNMPVEYGRILPQDMTMQELAAQAEGLKRENEDLAKQLGHKEGKMRRLQFLYDNMVKREGDLERALHVCNKSTTQQKGNQARVKELEVERQTLRNELAEANKLRESYEQQLAGMGAGAEEGSGQELAESEDLISFD